MLPRVLPFVILLIGVMVALYGGFATPSETAGLGAVLALVLIAIVYGVWRPRDLQPILVGDAASESTMLMFIIGMSLLFSYVMSYLHISQSTAEWIVALHLSKWLLLAAILLFVIVLGFFLPPVSHHPDDRADHPAAAQGRRLRPGLVRHADDHRDGDGSHPSAGRTQHLRHQEHRAGHSAARMSIWGVMPFVVLMFVAIVLICIVPGIAVALPDAVMGAGR